MDDKMIFKDRHFNLDFLADDEPRKEKRSNKYEILIARMAMIFIK